LTRIDHAASIRYRLLALKKSGKSKSGRQPATRFLAGKKIGLSNTAIGKRTGEMLPRLFLQVDPCKAMIIF